jgi:hypothetical protein
VLTHSQVLGEGGEERRHGRRAHKRLGVANRPKVRPQNSKGGYSNTAIRVDKSVSEFELGPKKAEKWQIRIKSTFFFFLIRYLTLLCLEVETRMNFYKLFDFHQRSNSQGDPAVKS